MKMGYEQYMMYNVLSDDRVVIMGNIMSKKWGSECVCINHVIKRMEEFVVEVRDGSHWKVNMLKRMENNMVELFNIVMWMECNSNDYEFMMDLFEYECVIRDEMWEIKGMLDYVGWDGLDFLW